MSPQTWLLAALLLPGGISLLHWGIRRGLAAPRVTESGDPAPLPYREESIPTANGRKLFAWLIGAAPGAPALIVMHGWGGNAEMMLPLAGPLHAAGYTLLFIDARCHGRSDEDSFASLPRFAEDIEAAVNWLATGTEPPARIGVIGHSVGAGAALLAASRSPAIRAVISLAAFAHPAAMMRRWLKSMHLPYWPIGAYILHYVQRTIGHRFDDIAPIQTIADIKCPVLLVHGLEDATIPWQESEAIYNARQSASVELRVMAGSHDDYGDLQQAIGILIDFLERQFGG